MHGLCATERARETQVDDAPQLLNRGARRRWARVLIEPPLCKVRASAPPDATGRTHQRLDALTYVGLGAHGKVCE